jgi:two-component system, sensor histidine kinase YesM
MMKKLKNSIFYRMIFVFCIVVIVFYSISAVVINMSAEKIQSEINASQLSKIENFSKEFKNEMLRIFEIQKQFVYDSDLQKLYYNNDIINDYTRGILLNRLLEKVSLLKSLSKYIKEVFIFVPAVGKTISSNTGIGQYSNSHFSQIREAISIGNENIICEEGEYYIILTSASSGSSPEQPYFNIIVQLSKEVINESLQSLLNESTGAVCLYNINKKWEIVQDNNFEKFNSILPAALDKNYEERSTIYQMKIGRQDYNLINVRDDDFNISLIYCEPNNILYKSLAEFKNIVWILTFCTCIICAALFCYVYLLFKQPVNILLYAFRQVENGDFNVSISADKDNEFGYLYHQFNIMLNNIKDLIQDVYEQKIGLRDAQLKQLQYQINPHFLYNSFFILYRMAKLEDYENITRYTFLLGNFYQFINRNGDKEITLEQEFNHCKNYIDIQKIRFRERITVTYEISTDLTKITVPSLILQPLIENCYEHGFLTKTDKGNINIRIFCDERVHIIIEDNGTGLTAEELKQLNERVDIEDKVNDSGALVNVIKRMRLKFGTSCRMHITSVEESGLKVELEFPMDV